jgi:ABC-type polysaccharide/polyol phosphate export permease
MAKSENNQNRLESVLAVTVAVVVSVSLVAMVIALLTRLFGGQPWAIFTQLPLVGLPFAFMLIIGLLITSLRRRSRENPRG